jgi:phosphate transport system substrate-binding protein
LKKDVAYLYKRKNEKGSENGIALLKAGKVEFAGTDWPFPVDATCAKTGSGPSNWQIATALGGIAIIYNLPGHHNDLELTPQQLSDIFDGSVTRWNKVRADLPDSPIEVVHRKDGSGTTRIFAEFLAKNNNAWRARIDHPGDRFIIDWPVGSGADGSDGVANSVRSKDGSIGYVEDYYYYKNAYQGDLSIGKVRNKSRQYILPRIATMADARDAVPDFSAVYAAVPTEEVPKNPVELQCKLLDSDSPNAYPITALTWIALPDPSATPPRAVCKFLRYGMDNGQIDAQGLGYARLPPTIVQRNIKAIDQICPPSMSADLITTH